METIGIVLTQHHNKTISRTNKTKRRIRMYKEMQAEMARQSQFVLFSASSLWTEKLLGTIKIDYNKIYIRPKVTQHTWENMLLHYSNSQWIENFRMTKETFLIICKLVNEDLHPKTHLAAADNFQSLSTEKQVAIAIYKLASYCEYRVVATLFGVGKSTVHKCLHRFCDALNKHSKKFIYMPNEEEAVEYSNGFEKLCNIPQIIGCVDETHIPILAPKIGYRDFVNRKYWTSFNMQAICNAQLRFLDISCKFPGSCHDAQVFLKSGVYKNIGSLLPQATKEVDGKDIPYFILGDPAPLLPWVMKNFPNTANKEEVSFNAYMNTGRVKIENAFMRLKSRWHIFSNIFKKSS